MPKVLSVDTGNKSGWSYWENGKYVKSGHLIFKTKPTQSIGYFVNTAYESYKNLIEFFKPDIVVYESVNRHLGTTAAHRYGALTGVLEQVCWLKNIKVHTMPVKAIKKIATGFGNADKELMLATAKKFINNNDLKSYDEADAILINFAYHQSLKDEVYKETTDQK